jgi:multidrug efflux pump subunit AcrA (membrane-fusion protein)
MKKILLTGILLLGMAFFGWQIYQHVNRDNKAVNRERKNIPVAVEVAPVRQATVQDIGWYSGSLYPNAAFVIAPKIGGRLEKIWVNIGDELQSSQLIAVLDDAEYKQQVSQAKAELDVARASLLEQENALENAKR